MPAEAQGIRAVNLRIGLVLGRDGGIFPRLALPASLGWPARIGDGRQWMSWIHIADLLRIIETRHRRAGAGAARSTPLRPAPNARAIFSARWRAACAVR